MVVIMELEDFKCYAKKIMGWPSSTEHITRKKTGEQVWTNIFWMGQNKKKGQGV